jgi:hypothetical protein
MGIYNAGKFWMQERHDDLKREKDFGKFSKGLTKCFFTVQNFYLVNHSVGILNDSVGRSSFMHSKGRRRKNHCMT